MHAEIAEMAIGDYDEVVTLWSRVEGIGLDDVDSRENTEKYLQRNPGLSFVARRQGKIVGAVLCGHDGRRGYLHHLAVDNDRRRQGIGKALVNKCLAGLLSIGIRKCNIFVFADNREGHAFWETDGWIELPDIKFMQKSTDGRD